MCKWDQCENCFALVQKEKKGTKSYLLSLTQHHLGWSTVTQFVYQQGQAIKESKQWSFQTLKPYLQQINIAPSACTLNLGPEESHEPIKGKALSWDLLTNIIKWKDRSLKRANCQEECTQQSMPKSHIPISYKYQEISLYTKQTNREEGWKIGSE